jgi:hypothetical protein
MTDPDPAHMLHYCSTVVPDMLTTVCGVDVDLAHRIGCDILDRAEAFAALTASDQRVLIVPFLEEAAHHQPLDASVDSRAKVTVVVRYSLLEQAHHDGLLTSGAIVSLTRSAVGPLSHLLAARHRNPIDHTGRTSSPGCPTATPPLGLPDRSRRRLHRPPPTPVAPAGRSSTPVTRRR